MKTNELIKCKDCANYLRNCMWYYKPSSPFIPNVCALYSTADRSFEVCDEDFCSKAELLVNKDIRKVVVEFSVNDRKAVEQMCGTLDYIGKLLTQVCNESTEVRVENARVIDDDDPEDDLAREHLNAIFNEEP